MIDDLLLPPFRIALFGVAGDGITPPIFPSELFLGLGSDAPMPTGPPSAPIRCRCAYCARTLARLTADASMALFERAGGVCLGEPLPIKPWLGVASSLFGDAYIGIPLCFLVRVCVFLTLSVSNKFSFEDVTDDCRDRAEYTLVAEDVCPGGTDEFPMDPPLPVFLPVICSELLDDELDILPLTELD